MKVDILRQYLYQWNTWRNNKRSIRELESFLESRDPVLLVHQMGRAGSMTTMNSLRGAVGSLPIFHTHWLHPAHIEKRLRRVGHLLESRQPLNVRIGRRIASELQREGTSRRHWKLVTVFREPIARNVSVFFLSIEDFVDDFFGNHARGKLNNQQLVDTFIQKFPHQQPLEWFDFEIRDLFGIDVYEHPFPQEQGYQIIRTEQVELLLLKLEQLNTCFQQAFHEFLGVDVSSLSHTHVTEQDPAKPMYAGFLREAVMPLDYLDRMYDSKFARHFYTESELAALRLKWSKRN